MSLCDYCGEKAGWFQSSHPACVTRADDMGRTVKGLVFSGTLAGKTYAELATEVQQALEENKVPFKYIREALLQGANDAVSQIALQSPVSEDEYNRLDAIVGAKG